VWTIFDAIRLGAATLSSSSLSPRLDSELLMRHLLGIDQGRLILLFSSEIEAKVYQSFLELIERRKSGEPMAYIVGYREFWGLEFIVNREVLVPRPESELVVELAIKHLCSFDSEGESLSVLDLGTGSGCLIVSIVREVVERFSFEIYGDALDISEGALSVARRNAAMHGVLQRVDFFEGSWFEPLIKPLSGSRLIATGYHCIVANPPYIDRSEGCPLELSYEPQGALFSDAAGLADTEQILRVALPLLRSDGVLLCEVGAGKRGKIEGVVARVLSQLAPQDFKVSYHGELSENDGFRVLRVERMG
jgi:release factor glutamine methyltransferase